MAAATIKLTQVRSPNGASPKQRDSLRTLRLGRIGATAEHPDEPTVRGAVAVVSHLVKVEG